MTKINHSLNFTQTAIVPLLPINVASC